MKADSEPTATVAVAEVLPDSPAQQVDEVKLNIRTTNPNANEINLFFFAHVRPDGSDLTAITNDPMIESEPLWMPDGNSIIYLGTDGSTNVYRVEVDTGEKTQLTNVYTKSPNRRASSP